MPEQWSVVTADIVGSSQIEDLPMVRDRLLRELSERHIAAGRVLAHYTVTAWDEFQNVLTHLRDLPDVIWDLRLAFYPIRLKIAIGYGQVAQLPTAETAVNKVSSGEAFVKAREAMDRLVRAGDKFSRLTAVRGGDRKLERQLNLSFMLMDSLLANLSDRQWEIVRHYESSGRQGDVARALGVAISTVSRTLQRANYWQLNHAREELGRLIDLQLSASESRGDA